MTHLSIEQWRIIVDICDFHTSTAVVVVFITDVNDNKPVFKDCSTYYPKVEEGAPNGSPVIKVVATDEDKGVNGQVNNIMPALFPRENCS